MGDENIELSFSGRLRNISLPPSADNSLLPVYEAVYNSIHAIEDRQKFDPIKGTVQIEVIDDPKSGNPIGYKISDNGIGLTDQNYKAFKESDSLNKATRNGKGVGRLTWLKVFEGALISSVYDTEGSNFSRSFKFSPTENRQITEHFTSENNPKKEIGTTVTLHPFFSPYGGRTPKKTETICNKFISHFLTYLLDDNGPSLIVVRDTVNDLRNALNAKIKRQHEEDRPVEISVEDEEGNDTIRTEIIKIKHLLIDRSLSDETLKGKHTIFLIAHGRVVTHSSIETIFAGEYVDERHIYIGLVSGPLLDNAVMQERSSFTLDSEILNSIKRAAIEASKSFLSEYFDKVRENQIATVESLKRENPRFINIVRDSRDFVLKNVQVQERSEEEIYMTLSRFSRREWRKREREFQTFKGKKEISEEIAEKIKKYSDFVEKESVAYLAEYMYKRKAILDLLKERKKYIDSDSKTYPFERALHELVVPLGATTDDLNYDDHNLWLLDDRMAFYNYFWSDKTISSIVDTSKSTSEPDILLYELGLGFQREKTSEPLILVEFKRPGRDDYTREKNPLSQLLDYIEKIRDGKHIVDKSGSVLSSVDKNRPIICYIVADLTGTLVRCLTGTPVIHKTSDGIGRHGYLSDQNVFVNVVPYQKLLDDAVLRHEAFFEKLGFS